MSQNEFISNFVNTYFAKNFEPSFENGQFSLLNRTSALATYPGGSQLCDLRLRTDFQVVGKQKRLEIDSTFTDLNGYNTKYISQTGHFVPEAALQEFSKTDFGKRVTTKDIEGKITGLTHRDCHTSYLYNMLISWARALLYKMNKTKEMDKDRRAILTVKCSPYQSAHVTVGLPDIAETSYRIILGSPNDHVNIPTRIRSSENFFEKPFVLHYNASSHTQECYYLVHAAGRTHSSALNFDFEIPGVDGDNVLLDRVDPCGDTLNLSQLEHIPWNDPDTQWQWILDYVTLNRLQTQFAATLETFGAMCCHPIWSSAEACAWQMSELVAVLGSFEPTRARLRTVLDGDPYIEDTNAIDYVIGAKSKPVHYWISSAILNYYMWYGLYAVIYNEAAGRTSWRTAFTSVHEALTNLYSPHMRAFCISAITGHEVPTSMSVGAGMHVSMQDMPSVGRILNTGKGTSGEEARVNVDAVYAPVTGSLLLGTFANDLEVVQHLKSHFGVQFRGTRGTPYSKIDLMKTATIYRLFGHSTTFFDEITQQEITPWAPVNECVPDLSSILFEPRDLCKLTVGWSEIRPGRCIPLPALGSLAENGSISVVIQKPHIEPVKFRTAQTPLQTYVTTGLTPKPVKVTVKSTYKYMPTRFHANVVKQYKQEGFHEIVPTLAPQRPEMQVVHEVPQITVSTEETPASVSDASLTQDQPPAIAQPGGFSNV